ncbi:hypothetical protein B0H13DRAFT_2268683 [Mycena leptocephala]|nr:hypothetical protein B0H13DRAFT_2268683 [Mycena leptocephala]
MDLGDVSATPAAGVGVSSPMFRAPFPGSATATAAHAPCTMKAPSCSSSCASPPERPRMWRVSHSPPRLPASRCCVANAGDVSGCKRAARGGWSPQRRCMTPVGRQCIPLLAAYILWPGEWRAIVPYPDIGLGGGRPSRARWKQQGGRVGWRGRQRRRRAGIDALPHPTVLKHLWPPAPLATHPHTTCALRFLRLREVIGLTPLGGEDQVGVCASHTSREESHRQRCGSTLLACRGHRFRLVDPTPVIPHRDGSFWEDSTRPTSLPSPSTDARRRSASSPPYFSLPPVSTASVVLAGQSADGASCSTAGGEARVRFSGNAGRGCLPAYAPVDVDVTRGRPARWSQLGMRFLPLLRRSRFGFRQ